MADSVELRMSVTSIKRVDPYVKDILATATHVALYKFNTSTNEWEKTETEGALFIYSRNGEPFHSIMVMNRLNTDNLIEPIVKEFDYQMQVPFLLYRNSKSKIFGIWFFNREECIRITFLIESIMERLKDGGGEGARRSSKENGVDIFSMLSKAQEDFNRTPTKQDSGAGGAGTFASTPRIPDVTSSVMDFFAKASSKSAGKGEGVLHRLMSNPAHSVEHIEKQQRSSTPQHGDTGPFAKGPPENGVAPRQTPKSSPLMMLLNQTPAAAPAPDDSSAEALGTSPFAQFLSDSHKPQLMTPMMFTNNTPQTSFAKEAKDDQLEVDLLTEKQLAQALIHLLKNNADFTKQIHEAYVNSILERVNLSSNKSLI